MMSATCREHAKCYIFIIMADCFGGIEVFMTVAEFCCVLGCNGIYFGGTCQSSDMPIASTLSIV